MARRRGLLFRILRVVLFISVLAVVLALASVWRAGAWNLLFPSHQHDAVAPAIPADLGSPAILVFSKTNSFRHSEGIAGGAKALHAIAEHHQWGMFHTENGAVFNESDLARFAVVVFLNASGDVLNEAQELAFQSWLQGGGGWLSGERGLRTCFPTRGLTFSFR